MWLERMRHTRMAQFATVVGAVNEVYQREGGTYTESTVTDLMQVAKALYDAFEGDIRAQPDRIEVIVELYYEDIVDAIRQLES